jgi:hypothetical protein
MYVKNTTCGDFGLISFLFFLSGYVFNINICRVQIKAGLCSRIQLFGNAIHFLQFTHTLHDLSSHKHLSSKTLEKRPPGLIYMGLGFSAVYEVFSIEEKNIFN